MLVYGDHVETISAAVEHDRLCARREALIAISPGLARHAALVNLHIEAGRLAQGLADRTFDPCVGDRFDGVNERWMAWLVEAARALIGSSISTVCGWSIPTVLAWRVRPIPRR